MAETGWTDELKEKAVKMYLDSGPTPENSMEIVKEVAEELDKTPNGVRRILSNAEVYVKKEAATGKAETGDKPKKVSKADAVAGLKTIIESTGQEVDDDVISKMTGKAALYFTTVIHGAKAE